MKFEGEVEVSQGHRLKGAEGGGRRRGARWTEGKGSAGREAHGYSRNDERLFSVVRCEGGVAGDGWEGVVRLRRMLGTCQAGCLFFSCVGRDANEIF